MNRPAQKKRFEKLRAAGRPLLPRALIRPLKKLYYPIVLKRFQESRWPPATIAKQLIRAGDTVVDAGANIGYVTLFFSRWVGPDGRVLGFEPVPETCELFRHNVRMLDLPNVLVHECGLSDRDGDAVMEIPLYDEGGGENLYESRIVSPGRAPAGLRRVTVRTKTLDSICAGKTFPRLSFVKIDVEGHEARVLEGMRTILNEKKPALLIELSGPPSGRADVFRELSGLGYAAYAWTGTTLQLCPEPVSAVDYFFLQSRHKALLNT